jgi:hypothetical protein
MNIFLFVRMGVCILRTLMSLLLVKGIIDVFGLMDDFCHMIAVL